MTIKELYEWAVENGCENYEVGIQYCDGIEFCEGSRELNENYIEFFNGLIKTVCL